MRLSADERTLVTQVSGRRLLAHAALVAKTPRLSGSPEERETFRAMARKLRAWGLEVERHEASVWTSWPGAAGLELLEEQPLALPCITHSMAAPTPDEGVVLDLVDIGRGDTAALAAHTVRGRAVLVDGLAMSGKVHALEAAGAAAQVHVSGDRLHEGIASIVWGSPTPETARLLPRTPVVSTTAKGGATLRAALARGPVRIRVRARVDTRWRTLPILIGHLRAPRSNGDFLLVSGHVDAWHAGAMDNAAGNATQLELAKILAGRRSRLRRDLRVAFWSGHSHARYGGSAWYADQRWRDLHEHCVLHLNVDCVGAQGATCLTEGIAMAEARDLGSDVLERVAGERLSGARPQRAGDQSFWGHGVPSLLMTPSEQPAGDSETARAYALLMGGQARSGGLGWWWHTPEDTLDKLDQSHLVRDAQIYLLVARRVLEEPVLPLDYRATATEMRATVEAYRAEAQGRFDLRPIVKALDELDASLSQLHRRAARRLSPGQARRLNRCLMALGRELIPIDYCRAERFEQDLTLHVPPLPGLEPMRRLGALPPDSDEARQLVVALVRQRNKVEHHLLEAATEVKTALAEMAAQRAC